MARQRKSQQARNTESVEARLATVAGRVSRLWRTRSGVAQTSSQPPDVGWESRFERLEARIDHLEAALEGLQNSVHRQAVRQDESIDDLRRRTAPDQLARDLSQDARERGL